MHFEAEFPDSHPGSSHKWRFTWTPEGFEITGMGRNFALFHDTLTNDVQDDPYFAGKTSEWRPENLLMYLTHLWTDIDTGASRECIQEAFEQLGNWCISSEQAIPTSEYWDSFNGRQRMLSVGLKES